MKREARGSIAAANVGVLGEEAVPGMDAVGAGLGGHRQELLDAAGSSAPARGADAHRVVGQVARAGDRAVGVGVHRDRRDAHPVAACG